MNRRGVIDVGRGLLAAVLLLGLVVGPPVLLIGVAGWPIPSRLPTVDQLREVLGGSTIDDSTIVKTLALVCWAAWLQVVVSAIVEVEAWARGNVARRIPLGGLVQPAIRQIVISAALVLASLRPVQSAPMSLATVVPAEAALVELPSPPLDLAVAAVGAHSPVQSVAPATGTITVNARDSLWRLAERHLGDGMRWRELWELNRDRTFPDGRVFRNPNLIQPGWALTCPPDAVDVDVAPPTPTPIAPDTAEQAPSSDPLPEPQVTPSSPAVERAPAGTAPAAEPAAVNPAEASVPNSEPERPPADKTDREIPVGVVAASLVAAGFVALLDRLRRIQVRRRHPGHAPAAPAPAAAVSETALRCAAADAPAERLDLALRALAGCLATGRRKALPGIALASVAPEAVEIVLTDRSDAKAGPFEVSPDGRAWTLATAAPFDEVQRLAAGQASPAPALVTVGMVDDRQVLIDLEASPRLLVTGDRNAVKRTVWSMALEMTTNTWADDVEVIVLGERNTSLDRLERATVTSDLDDVVGRLERAASAAERDLPAAGAASTLACRVRNPGDPWTPVVLLVPEPLAESERQLLFDLASPGHGVAVVAAAEAGAADVELAVDATTVTLLPLGLQMRPASLPDELLDGVDELLVAALSDEPGEELVAMASAHPPPLDYAPSPSPSSPSPGAEDARVLVSVLGPVEVHGAERGIDRRRSLELVVYLALHPEGADEGRLRAVLWPESNPSRENFNQTVSRARQALGHAPDGTLHLPRLTDEALARYYLGLLVTSDAALLEAAYVAARRDQSDGATEHLASLLGLIRGIPFEGTKGGWQWSFTEGHAARLASLAADAAHLVAQWALQRGDVQRALWATSQGLRAAPGDEILYRDRMQAHDQSGNIAGVEAAMVELCRTVEDGEPYDSIHPETLAYYEQLKRRVRRTG